MFLPHTVEFDIFYTILLDIRIRNADVKINANVPHMRISGPSL